MAIIIGILVAFLVICAILLVLIVLIQDDGADGAGMILGSVASQQYGVRKGNIVTRTTGILATVFMVLSFTLAFLLKGGDDTQSLQKLAEGQAGSSVNWWEKTAASADTENYLGVDAATIPAEASAAESTGTPANTAADSAAPATAAGGSSTSSGASSGASSTATGATTPTPQTAQ